MRNLSQQERHDIALTIAGEIDPRITHYGTATVRREMASILGVIENRSALRKKSLSEIVHQPSQFSTWNTKKGRRNARNNYAKYGVEIDAAVDDYFAGYLRSPVHNATHYWAPKAMLALTGSPEPYWGPAIQGKTRVGAHTFGYKKDEPKQLFAGRLARSLPFESAGTMALVGGPATAAGIGGLSLLSLGKDVANSSVRGAIGAARDRLASTYGDLAATMGPSGMLGLDGRMPTQDPNAAFSPTNAPGGILPDPATTRSVLSPGNLPDQAPTPTARPSTSPSYPSLAAQNGPGVAVLGPAPRSLMDDVRAKDWSTASLPPGADPRLSSLSVYSPEGLAGRIGETKALYGEMPSASGHLPGATPDDIDAVMASRAWGPNPTEMAARIAAYRDPANTVGLQALQGRREYERQTSARSAPGPSRIRPDDVAHAVPQSGLPSRPLDMRSRQVASAFGDPIQSFTPQGTEVSGPVTPAGAYAPAMSFANDRSTRKADRLGPQTPMRDNGWTGGLSPGQRKSIQQQAYEANLANASSIPGMLAGLDALGQPNANAPIEDTRREAVEEAREQARVTAYDRAKIPHVVTSTRFTPDLQPIERAPAPREQPTISAPPNSTQPAWPDMRNTFPPAPPVSTQMGLFKAELGPALRQALLGELVGGLPGAAIGLVGGLLGNRHGGLLGALGPGFDAAVPSADRFSTGSGLDGILSAMGGLRGAQGSSRSNPGMSYTSLGPGMGGLRRSDRFGWTETVGPDGEVRGISYDNGGGGLLGGLSRGLGSLFSGNDSGANGASKGKRGGPGKYSGAGLF